jgi:hypothetical protein
MTSRTTTLASPSVIRPLRSTMVTPSTCRVLVFSFSKGSSPKIVRQYSTENQWCSFVLHCVQASRARASRSPFLARMPCQPRFSGMTDNTDASGLCWHDVSKALPACGFAAVTSFIHSIAPFHSPTMQVCSRASRLRGRAVRKRALDQRIAWKAHLIAISRVCGPVAKPASSSRQPLVLSRSSVLAHT